MSPLKGGRKRVFKSTHTGGVKKFEKGNLEERIPTAHTRRKAIRGRKKRDLPGTLKIALIGLNRRYSRNFRVFDSLQESIMKPWKGCKFQGDLYAAQKVQESDQNDAPSRLTASENSISFPICTKPSGEGRGPPQSGFRFFDKSRC